MMDKISESLGTLTPVSPMVAQKEDQLPEKVTEKIDNLTKRASENLGADYEEVRGNLKDLIDHSMKIIPDIFEVVKESQSARMYESASGFIKMVSELNKDLLDITLGLEKKRGVSSDSKNEKNADGGTVNNNVAFVGSPDELFTMLSRRNNSIDADFKEVEKDK